MGRCTSLFSSQFAILLAWTGLLLIEAPYVFPALPQKKQETATKVDFSRDIRPIFSDKCFACHGPDEATRMSKLRLDTEEGAFKDLGGRHAIVPSNPNSSEVIRRITAEEKSRRMPPPYSDYSLSKKEINLIRLWIKQGAPWLEHWSFLPPHRPNLPKIKNTRWVKNEIDYFILERLETEKLTPSKQADHAKLLRRVSLDLTGLPPTPKEVDAYLSNPSQKAYDAFVDQLLASPRFGERMAAEWLDAARYADTNGYQTDGERFMWRWRDWVINAFNKNMPFDQFTVEQLAGDMLPNPTLDEIIATGFNRNHRGNGEGGIIPEEYAVEYVVDRVDATSTVWLGLTMGCARCHDHKYDPITQKEFYQFYSFFNNIPERGKALKYGNSPPLIKAPTQQQNKRLAGLEKQLSASIKKFKQLEDEIKSLKALWEQSLSHPQSIHWTPPRHLIATFSFDGGVMSGPKNKSGKTISSSRFKGGVSKFVSGKIGFAPKFNGNLFFEAGDFGAFGFHDRFSAGAWIYPTDKRGGIILSRMSGDQLEGKGYCLELKDGKIHLQLLQRWLDDAIRVKTELTLSSNRWHHILFTYNGSQYADGIKIYINGKNQKLLVPLDALNQDFKTDEPLRVGSGDGEEGRFYGIIDEVFLYGDVILPSQAKTLATSTPISEIASKNSGDRTPGERNKITNYFLELKAPASIKKLYKSMLDLRDAKEEYFRKIQTTMVMQERETPPQTHILIRGSYDQKGPKVNPGVPDVLSRGYSGPLQNRLDFARWIVDTSNPLTSRVAVNRLWQMIFGVGLVKTVDNFGSQGSLPSHPKLLDWLATEFVRTDWNVKNLLKIFVTSSTYRQSSHLPVELRQKDPENRLLARGPRLRLPAEVIRDQALLVSGLLFEKIGGPSVKPYQPTGLWKELSDGATYQLDQGKNLYRRSLYTFWKRTNPPPSMITFDAAGRETCIVRESRTNTPLQALNLMNDVTFVETSRVLAERIITEGKNDPKNRIQIAFRLATGRYPTDRESDILLEGFHRHKETYQRNSEAALRLVEQGNSPRNKSIKVEELAAYTMITSLILNLDEIVTKE